MLLNDREVHMGNLGNAYEAILRTLFSYLFLLLLTRIMGRKQIAQLTFFDYVTSITIGSIAGVVAIDQSIDLRLGIVSLSVWTLGIMITNYFTKNSVPARKIIDSHPILVLYDGKILEDNLGRMHYNVDDLLMQLRGKDVFDPSEVELGIMEPNGQLTVKKKPQFSNIASKDSITNQTTALDSKFSGVQLVVDGVVIEKELETVGISKHWLIDQLKKQGVTNVATVMTATIKPDGTLYIDKK